jgi:hypothetical protein
VLDFQAEYPVKAFGMESLIYLPMFIAGFGCGFYVRDWVFKRQRPRFLVAPYQFPATAAPPRRAPERTQEKTEQLAPVDFKTVQMSDELRSLLKLLPPDETRRA